MDSRTKNTIPITELVKSDILTQNIEEQQQSLVKTPSKKSSSSFFSSWFGTTPEKDNEEISTQIQSISNLNPSALDSGISPEVYESNQEILFSEKPDSFIVSGPKSSRKSSSSSSNKSFFDFSEEPESESSSSLFFSDSSEDSLSKSASSSSSSSTFSFLGFLSNITWTTWLVIILLLAFVGFNIFVYLAKGTQDITNTFAPLLKKILGFFGIATLGTTKQIVEVSGEGTKGVINTGANIATGAVNTVQKGADSLPPKPRTKEENVEDQIRGQNTRFNENDYVDNTGLGKALNSTQPQKEGGYEAALAASTLQGDGKAGWCLIGRDDGYRSCAQITESDTCMSGNIFPSREICVNPMLRM